MSESLRDGVVWDDSGFECEPRWTSEPSLEAIKTVCQRTLQIEPDDCSVSFLAQGAFNKIFTVHDGQQHKSVMRVSLPVEPGDKTSGEVATLRWLEKSSSIPIPKVIAFDDARGSEIGFEWILMQLVPGTSASRPWRKLSMDTKAALVQKIASHHANMFNTSTFRGIGTLKQHTAATGVQWEPGKMVSRLFFWGDHWKYDIPRGPFRSSHDWLKSFISIILLDQKKAMDDAEDEEDRDDAEYNFRVAQALGDLLPKVFPSIQDPPERTVVWHDDLSLENIMVDQDGSLTGVIDWECVSAVPLWVATQMPKFLRGATREEEPRRDGYGDEDLDGVDAPDPEGDGLDNEGKNMLYWIHLMEYEQTQLRKVYSSYMSEHCAGWDAVVADSTLKLDFLGAIFRCADGFYLKRIEKWAELVSKGEFSRLVQ
ncbi:phosphotransferase enzyme family-domain-containing protein [Stachybotrys elegans]|uniref:Phosphotransferase enzyme family-domain-containing protein n=1 Tax=Stachybotrys elegans TaxID=80388 RepID=A0A8K0WKG9_9HYPO|nr:phosphotransferase enzyme family-domain-containing protein [Stachybotrys elegans]